MSQIFTVGVTPAVRRQVGAKCWDYVPEKIAVWTIRNLDSFDSLSLCQTYPTNSPSLGWEMRYSMDVYGFNDCSSLVDLHQNALGSCVRYEADARAFATFGYMIGILVGLVLCVTACMGICTCFCD